MKSALPETVSSLAAAAALAASASTPPTCVRSGQHLVAFVRLPEHERFATTIVAARK